MQLSLRDPVSVLAGISLTPPVWQRCHQSFYIDRLDLTEDDKIWKKSIRRTIFITALGETMSSSERYFPLFTYIFTFIQVLPKNSWRSLKHSLKSLQLKVPQVRP